MSIAILVISLIFALIETGLSWLLLAFEPVAGLFAGMPLWVVTGLIFAIGMILTFVVIILVGSMNVSDRAASFVRDQFGRTLLLALMSIIAVLVVSIGGEMLYQANPLQRRQKQSADICYVLDFSGSMRSSLTSGSGNRETAMKDAFAAAVNSMSDGQRICVVQEGLVNETDDVTVLCGWKTLYTPSRLGGKKTGDYITRDEIIGLVEATPADCAWNYFDISIEKAGELVDEGIANRRSVSVIFMSDGFCEFSGVSYMAPTIIDNKVKIHTILLSDDVNADADAVRTLQGIASETGGTYSASAGDATALTQTFVETTAAASNSGRANGVDIPDTLITPRWASRQTIINARVLRLIVLFLLGFFFKLIANICIGNNDRSFAPHLLHAAIIGILAACVVEFGYSFGLPLIAVLAIFWVLMLTQIVLTDR